MAKLEGLYGHSAAAQIRLDALSPPTSSTNAAPASPFVSPERPLHITPSSSDAVVKLALPKGRMETGKQFNFVFKNLRSNLFFFVSELFKLLNEAGLSLKVESRGYRPTINIPNFDVKLLKPQNIVEMVNIGSRDIGFTGADLVEELGAKAVTRVSPFIFVSTCIFR